MNGIFSIIRKPSPFVLSGLSKDFENVSWRPAKLLAA